MFLNITIQFWVFEIRLRLDTPLNYWSLIVVSFAANMYHVTCFCIHDYMYQNEFSYFNQQCEWIYKVLNYSMITVNCAYKFFARFFESDFELWYLLAPWNSYLNWKKIDQSCQSMFLKETNITKTRYSKHNLCFDSMFDLKVWYY